MCENIHDSLVLRSVPSMFSGEDWTQVEFDLEQMNETNETKPKWKTISLVAEKEEQNEVFIPHHRHTVCNYQQRARSYDSLKHTAKSKLFYYLGIFPQNICFIFIMKTSYFIRCLTSHEHFRKWRRNAYTYMYIHAFIHTYIWGQDHLYKDVVIPAMLPAGTPNLSTIPGALSQSSSMWLPANSTNPKFFSAEACLMAQCLLKFCLCAFYFLGTIFHKPTR